MAQIEDCLDATSLKEISITQHLHALAVAFAIVSHNDECISYEASFQWMGEGCEI